MTIGRASMALTGENVKKLTANNARSFSTSTDSVSEYKSKGIAVSNNSSRMEVSSNAQSHDSNTAIEAAEAGIAGKGTEEVQEEKNQRLSLSRVISSRSAASSWRDPGPPPDGGVQAWIQVLMAHLVVISTWGFIISFGVFQIHYKSKLDRPPSDISWIGSIQLFLTFLIGTVSGRALDAGYFHQAFGAGMALQMVGIFTVAEATSYWQVMLAQGVCLGVANGLQFCPTLSLLSTYFAKRKGLAIGIVASGSSVGGLIYPSIVRELLPKVGFAWTVRVLGFVTLATNLLAIAFLRPRLPPRKSGPIIEWAALREKPFVLYCAGMFLQLWGLFFAFYYIGTFARNVTNLSTSDAIALLLVMNGIGIPGRLITNSLSDSITGPVNAMIVSTSTLAILMLAWSGVSTSPGLWAFSAIYGFFAAGVQGLFPAALSSLTTDLRKAGARMGMGFFIVSFACLTGPPLAGVLVQLGDGTNYLYAQLWAGMSMLCGSLLVLGARVSLAGWTVKKMV